MKLGVLALVALLSSSQVASGNTLIVWAPNAKTCGGNNHRPSYKIERLATVDAATISARRKAIDAQGLAAGATYVWQDTVPKDSCVAVAYMDRKVGSCTIRTHGWRVGIDEEAAVAAVEKLVKTSADVTGSGIVEVQCSTQKAPKSGDTTIGIRG